MEEKTFHLKNMYTQSCVALLRHNIEQLSFIQNAEVKLGFVKLSVINWDMDNLKSVEQLFEKSGFTVLMNQDQKTTESIKLAAIELIFLANNVNSLVRNSDYISDKLQMPYEKLSRVFSKVTGITLEKYLILLKVEKTKELLLNDEFSLSEISYMLGYSSVQYLSNQFKKVTGFTVSEFKHGEKTERIPLEELISFYKNSNF